MLSVFETTDDWNRLVRPGEIWTPLLFLLRHEWDLWVGHCQMMNRSARSVSERRTAAKSRLLAAKLSNVAVDGIGRTTAILEHHDPPAADLDGNVHNSTATNTWVQTAMSRVFGVRGQSLRNGDIRSDTNSTETAAVEKRRRLG